MVELFYWPDWSVKVGLLLLLRTIFGVVLFQKPFNWMKKEREDLLGISISKGFLLFCSFYLILAFGNQRSKYRTAARPPRSPDQFIESLLNILKELLIYNKYLVETHWSAISDWGHTEISNSQIQRCETALMSLLRRRYILWKSIQINSNSGWK